MNVSVKSIHYADTELRSVFLREQSVSLRHRRCIVIVIMMLWLLNSSSSSLNGRIISAEIHLPPSNSIYAPLDISAASVDWVKYNELDAGSLTEKSNGPHSFTGLVSRHGLLGGAQVPLDFYLRYAGGNNPHGGVSTSYTYDTSYAKDDYLQFTHTLQSATETIEIYLSSYNCRYDIAISLNSREIYATNDVALPLSNGDGTGAGNGAGILTVHVSGEAGDKLTIHLGSDITGVSSAGYPNIGVNGATMYVGWVTNIAVTFAKEFYVSTSGNDDNSGTLEHPFQTLRHARDTIRALKRSKGLPAGGVRVVIESGHYVLSTPLELLPEDSGSADSPVIYMAAPGERPVITSARLITGWEKCTEFNNLLPAITKGHLWFANIPKGWLFHNFYVDGRSQQVAQVPSSGVKSWRSWPTLKGHSELTPDGLEVTMPQGLLANLPSDGDVEVNFLPFNYWNALAVLKKVKGDSAILASRNPCTLPLGGKYYAVGSICFRNALSLMGKPGQWCVDSKAGRVYYWPPDGNMEGKTVTAPILYELVRFQGDDLSPQSNNWRVKFSSNGDKVESVPALTFSSPSAFTEKVHDVQFRGITFECTDRMPEDKWPEYWLKRNAENPDGTMYLQGAEDCTITDCTFRNCGAYAIVLDHYAQRISIIRNEMTGLGCGGVEILGYGPGTLDVNGRNLVCRNYIHSLGRDYMHSAAITIFGSNHNAIFLNWIADVPYAGVAIAGVAPSLFIMPNDPDQGMCCDLYGNRAAQFQMREYELPHQSISHPVYGKYISFIHCGGNYIARNIVDNFMTTLDDGGALYCWSADDDNLWLENLLKRHGYQSGAEAGYADDWTGRCVFESNLAWMRGRWLDNSHIPSPLGRPIAEMSEGTVPPVVATGKTDVWWRDNVMEFPSKPTGFDERFTTILNEVRSDGGWPASVTEDTLGAFRQAP